MIGVRLVGANGTPIRVTPSGELIVAAFDRSTPTFQNMDVVDTAYNFVTPATGQQFIITTIIVSTNRNVGANGTTIDLYEATAVDSTSIVKSILQFDMAKNKELPMIGLDLKTTSGVWVNGKCDDDDVLMTVAGYFIPKLPTLGEAAR